MLARLGCKAVGLGQASGRPNMYPSCFSLLPTDVHPREVHQASTLQYRATLDIFFGPVWIMTLER